MALRLYAAFAVLCVVSLLACSFLEPTMASADRHGIPQSQFDGVVRGSVDAAVAAAGVAEALGKLPGPVGPIADSLERLATGYERGVRDGFARAPLRSRTWTETLGIFVGGVFAGLSNLLFRRFTSSSPAPTPAN